MSDYIPEAGDYFTVSSNRINNDRSWCEKLLYCEAVNEGHVLAEVVFERLESRNRRVLLFRPEYSFYEAGDIADKLTYEKLKANDEQL